MQLLGWLKRLLISFKIKLKFWDKSDVKWNLILMMVTSLKVNYITCLEI